MLRSCCELVADFLSVFINRDRRRGPALNVAGWKKDAGCSGVAEFEGGMPRAIACMAAQSRTVSASSDLLAGRVPLGRCERSELGTHTVVLDSLGSWGFAGSQELAASSWLKCFGVVSACFGLVSAFFAKSSMFMRFVSAFRRLTPFF